MNQINKQITSEIEVAAEAGVDSRPVASSSRRRLIKLGVSAVPVLATLTSPSALAAGVCRSTSAWGSSIINPATSQTIRTTLVADSWKISAWNSTDQSANTPWAAYVTKYGNSPSPELLTFEDIYTAVGSSLMRSPSSLGFTSTIPVMGNLTNNNQGYFFVAMLNYAIGQKPPTDCVSEANWRAIVDNRYPTSVDPWNLTKIREYLQNNNIVEAGSALSALSTPTFFSPAL